jgi:hypothetical protein
MARSSTVDLVARSSSAAHSQARRLDQVEEMARVAIALMLDLPAERLAVEVRPELPPAAARVVEARRTAKEAAKEAEESTTQAVRALLSDGFTVRDIARCWDSQPSGSRRSLISLPKSRSRPAPSDVWADRRWTSHASGRAWASYLGRSSKLRPGWRFRYTVRAVSGL